ncbi:extracellular solute-binding protein [Planomonospora venezuelensis]|uniref:Multiple sugar transport system substrate-binding protein n=1 Tax=Planomonospora venezuelensis TaxID=1999 RepID=A0A841D808_PLAVE|nr:extracellular solute-binding protein [Planomonospora venezuelensis]MBB5966351.1 multiple sugar transport system substrate-binding protein [Planomonospora venezuelensis]GIM99758.1 sugar ABC transporter substrate-binding protein [Planomonospora venezuelensis]
MLRSSVGPDRRAAVRAATARGGRGPAAVTLSTAVITTMIAALAACGGVGSGGGGERSGGGASLTTMGFGLPDEIATVRVDAFKKANPGIALQINEGQFDEQAFLSAVAAGSPPDVVYLGRDRIGSYAARGAIQPLDGCVAEQDVPVGDFYPAAQQQVKYDGKWYGMPEFYNSIVLVVGDKAAKDAGVDPAEIDTSDWERLAELAEKMTRTEGGKIERFGFYPKLPEFLPLWAKANGADILSADGRTSRLDDPKAAEALAYAHRLVEAQGGWTKLKAFTDTFDYFGEGNPFVKDQIGAMLTEQFVVTAMAGTTPDVKITVLPFKDRQGNPVNNVGGNAWVVPKGAKNPDAACAWIKTMTAADTWIAAARARAAKRAQEGKAYTGTYTGNAKADEVIFSEIVKPSGKKPFDDAVKVIRSVQEAGFVVPQSAAAAAEFKKAWEDAATRVLQGEQQPADALERAHTEAQKAIDEATS